MGQERDIYDRNNKDQEKNATTILSARIHEYQRPLSIDDIPKPRISTGEQVLVKVASPGILTPFNLVTFVFCLYNYYCYYLVLK